MIIYRILVLSMLFLILLNTSDVSPGKAEMALDWLLTISLWCAGIVACIAVVAFFYDRWDADKGVDWLNPRNTRFDKN